MCCNIAFVISYEGFRKWAFLRHLLAIRPMSVLFSLWFLGACLCLVDNTDFDSFDVHDQLFSATLVIPGAFLAMQQRLCIPHFLL